MPKFICQACGTQFPESPAPPPACRICQDDRQYVPVGGQAWVTLDDIVEQATLRVADEAPGITGIGTTVRLGIGQRPLLVQTKAGNVLWDCMPYLNAAVVSEIEARGGADAIAISHPHYYSNMALWSERLGGIPIHLHEDNREWVVSDEGRATYWSGETLKLNDELTLIRCGGHFPGSTAMHWRGGMDGKGALFVGDTLYVTQGRDRVSIMYSYPNLIPLPASTVARVQEILEPYPYDAIFAAWWDMKIMTDAKAIVENSLERYKAALGDRHGL